ncbi:PepSY-associated TM helix domain-containing protein [Sphingomonas sp.]|uniref:PepSY-associated TM helix domain-containing protein n=1 Tax=Sphingomonas sp. TaxID=28214 RepID=UPI0031DD3BDF
MAGIALRSIGLRVHRWLALTMGWLLIAVALSGVALVWSGPIDRITHPARYRISGETRIAAQDYATAARQAMRPGERIAGLSMQDGSRPVIVTLQRTDGQARMLFLDPPTGRMLAYGARDRGVVPGLRALHDALLIPGIGHVLVGMVGIAACLSAITGLGLWAVRDRSQRRAKAKERSRAMHRRLAPWAMIPLILFAASGVALAFPSGLALLIGADAARSPHPVAPPLARPALSVARVVAGARAWPHGRLTQIDWPTERSPDWTLHFAGPTAPAIKVADDSGSAIAAPARGEPIARFWAYRWHSGAGLSWIWRLFATASGLLIALLATSGLIGWARRR